ncbi:MAG: dTDP-4-dehydrorhamnose 3,5-epimerase [Oscillospiraceae bacterium]|nr:dTDP-4-dehydrorhamnose 3,5-epimerase [Oscillospiraceae bacterium]
MGKFKFTSTGIDGLTVVQPTVFGDERGYFMETYQQAEFAAAGIPTQFLQDNQSRSCQGVLRGLHFQKKNPQGKLVRVISGEVFDVAVDLRKDSVTFGKWFGVTLNAENKKQFFVPEGFAHGFAVLSESAEFVYKCTRLYDPSDEGGIIWNDQTLAIDWHLGDITPVVSEKDKLLGSFANI